jgi:hypothetical protein
VKKIRKITFGGDFYIAFTSRYLVAGRPRTGRHISFELRGSRVVAHLTNEKLPQKQHSHLGTIRRESFERLQQEMETTVLDGFLDGLLPVNGEILKENGFKLATPKSYGLKAVRLFFKPKLRRELRIREPSEGEMVDLHDHIAGRLIEPDQLDSLIDLRPGTVHAVLMIDGIAVASYPLFFYPKGTRRSDGTGLPPGWYGLVEPQHMATAQAKAFLAVVGPNFFSKVERALRFLRISTEISALEMEDVLRRMADGETIEEIRAARDRTQGSAQ